jgi:hypothetical protein
VAPDDTIERTAVRPAARPVQDATTEPDDEPDEPEEASDPVSPHRGRPRGPSAWAQTAWVLLTFLIGLTLVGVLLLRY